MPRRAKGIPNVSIYKPKARSGPRNKWLIAYEDADGERVVESVSTDYDVTRSYAREISRRIDQRKLGLLTPADERFAEHAAKPLLPKRDDDGRPVPDERGDPTPSHLGDYVELLRARRREAKTVQMLESRVTRLLDLMEAESIEDVTQEGVELAVAALAEEDDLAPQTCVHYLKALKQFTRWLRKSKRARADEAEDVEPFNVQTDIRHPRRALSDDEITRLLAAAAAGVVHVQGSHEISGAERELLYLLALETGLRANELRSLKPASFQEVNGRHYVVVEARTSKHRRLDQQPLRASVWARVMAHVAGRPAGKPIWDVPPKTFLMIAADLVAADIPYETAAGFADFHALRHTFCTRVGRSGATPKECQDLMRHSDIRLTMRYMHATLHDLARAVERLPEIAVQATAAVLRMTGTDGGAGAQQPAQRTAVPQCPAVARSDLPGADARGHAPNISLAQTAGAQGVYASGGHSARLRSTEPKVAGSSPASCVRPAPPEAVAPSALAGDAAASSFCPPEKLSAPGAAPAGSAPKPAPNIVLDAQAPAAPAAADPPLDMEAIKRLHRQLGELLRAQNGGPEQ
jgi:integrase